MCGYDIPGKGLACSEMLSCGSVLRKMIGFRKSWRAMRTGSWHNHAGMKLFTNTMPAFDFFHGVPKIFPKNSLTILNQYSIILV